MMRKRSERGLLTTELAILMPVMLVISLVAVFAVNVQRHGGRAQQAADAAARAASLERTPDAAQTAAQRAAEAVCRGPVEIEIPIGFVEPVATSFTPGYARIVLRCSEPFSGFKPLVQDQTRTSQASAVAVIEYWLGQE